jgi:hypothetical protein
VKFIYTDISLLISFLFSVNASLSLDSNGLACDLKIHVSCLQTNDGLEI